MNVIFSEFHTHTHTHTWHHRKNQTWSQVQRLAPAHSPRGYFSSVDTGCTTQAVPPGTGHLSSHIQTGSPHFPLKNPCQSILQTRRCVLERRSSGKMLTGSSCRLRTALIPRNSKAQKEYCNSGLDSGTYISKQVSYLPFHCPVVLTLPREARPVEGQSGCTELGRLLRKLR